MSTAHAVIRSQIYFVIEGDASESYRSSKKAYSHAAHGVCALQSSSLICVFRHDCVITIIT